MIVQEIWEVYEDPNETKILAPKEETGVDEEQVIWVRPTAPGSFRGKVRLGSKGPCIKINISVCRYYKIGYSFLIEYIMKGKIDEKNIRKGNKVLYSRPK